MGAMNQLPGRTFSVVIIMMPEESGFVERPTGNPLPFIKRMGVSTITLFSFSRIAQKYSSRGMIRC